MYNSTSYSRRVRLSTPFCETIQPTPKTHLQPAGTTELIIGEEVLQLVPGLDAVALVPSLASENLGDIGIVPRLNIIVARIPPMDVSLDSVTFVTNDESRDGCISTGFIHSRAVHSHDRAKLIPKHCAYFLNCQLGASISNEQNGSAVILFFGSQCCTLAGAH